MSIMKTKPHTTPYILGLCILVLALSTPAYSASCHFYQVGIRGITGFNGTQQEFSITEYAMWRTQGVAGNPVEFLISPFTDLNASPQVGAIEMMTNSAFARNAGIASARFNLAQVSITQSSISPVINFQVDSGMSLQLPPPNVMLTQGVGTIPGGLGGLGFLTGAGAELAQLINSAPILSVSYLVPRSGSGQFYSPDGTWYSIAGNIGVDGSSVDNPNVSGQYRAQFNGQYIGSQTCD